MVLHDPGSRRPAATTPCCYTTTGAPLAGAAAGVLTAATLERLYGVAFPYNRDFAGPAGAATARTELISGMHARLRQPTRMRTVADAIRLAAPRAAIGLGYC